MSPPGRPGAPSAPSLPSAGLQGSLDAWRFVNALRLGRAVGAQGLAGRIILGQTEAELANLAPADRHIVFLTDEEGLEALCGKSNRQKLEEIGYPRDYVAQKVDLERNRFRLVVFPASLGAHPATWNNLIALARQAYPALGDKLTPRIARELARSAFAELERELERDLGCQLARLRRAGPADPRYLTPERLAGMDGTAAQVRGFLYLNANVNELFTGTGYTQTPEGDRGVRELITLNRPVSQLGGAVLDLPMEPAPAAPGLARSDRFDVGQGARQPEGWHRRQQGESKGMLVT